MLNWGYYRQNMVQLLFISTCTLYIGLVQGGGENTTTTARSRTTSPQYITYNPPNSTTLLQTAINTSGNIYSVSTVSNGLDASPPSNKEQYAWAVMLSIIGIVGTVGNGLQLIFCLSKRRNILHVLLANMAVADILLCAVYVPFYAYSMLKQGWYLDGKICTALGYLYIFLNPISIWNHVILLAYCLVITSDNNLNKRYKWTTALALCVLAVWLVSLFSLLLMTYLTSKNINVEAQMTSNNSSYDHTRCNCGTIGLSWHKNLTARVGVSLITLLPISVAACMIGYVLCKIGRTKAIGPPGGGSPPASFSVLQRTMASAVAFFTLCLLPDWVCATFDPNQRKLPGSFHRASVFFMLVKGIIGPILTLLVVKEFRHALVFCCNKKKMAGEGGPFKILESFNLKTVDIKAIEEELEDRTVHKLDETCHI